jgi:predicted PurR-regulated permease PerM
MPEGESSAVTARLRRTLTALLLGMLAAACVLILRPFFSPIIWATILAYASWPVYRRLRALLYGSNTSAALLMTVLITCAVVAPVIWLLFLVQAELLGAYRALSAYLMQGPGALPPRIRDIPWLGNLLEEQLIRYSSDPTELARQAASWIQRLAIDLASVLGNIGRNLVKVFLTVLTIFFLYRDGETVTHQVRHVAGIFFGDRLNRYAAIAGLMTRAVLYGVLATAFAQGLVAGIGYRLIGLQGSALLGALTGVASAVPAIGTALVWLPVSVWLLATGSIWKGLLLAAWGTLLVHPIDNVLRPLLISNATRAPLLLVMYGVIGGLGAFGFVGIFIGPVLLGIAMTIWREWTQRQEPVIPAADSHQPETGDRMPRKDPAP